MTVAISLQMAALRSQSPPHGREFERTEIARAVEAVKADPNLAPERTIKTLRWTGANDRRRSATPTWLVWIVGLFIWLDQSGRALIWCTAVIVASLLVVYLTRLFRRFEAPDRAGPLVVPTHVGDLDIRPERLPADIGSAARALWDCGEHRAALALLYRGLLSRLAHVHGVPIRDSSTEGECLSLAAAHLSGRRREYSSDIVRVWLRAVYGREEIPTATIHVLCDDFAPALDSMSPADGLILRSPA
jgi:hypothetical protein